LNFVSNVDPVCFTVELHVRDHTSFNIAFA